MKNYWNILMISFFISIFIGIHSSTLFGKELKIAVSVGNAPYTIMDEKSGKTTGIHIDIVNEALAFKKHKGSYISFPFGRLHLALEEGDVDASVAVGKKEGSSIYYSDPAVGYDNVVITLKERNFSIKTFDDLKILKIVSFPNARKYLGPEFAQIAKINPRYKESSRPKSAIGLLFSKRIDALVWDLYVVHYHKSQALIDTSASLSFHRLWKPTLYPVAFRDKQIRDDFNEGLDHLKKTGKYDQILHEFLSKHK